MEEHWVTADSTLMPIEAPFLVIATQNPTEPEGPYPLPEAQLARFAMRLRMGYPSKESSLAILETHGGRHDSLDDLEPVADADDIRLLIEGAQQVHVAPSLK